MGLGDSDSAATSWGAPAVDVSSWLSEYGPWLLIGALVLLGMATSGQVKREKKKVRARAR